MTYSNRDNRLKEFYVDRDLLLLLMGGGIGVLGTLAGGVSTHVLQRRIQAAQWAHEQKMRLEQWTREDIKGLRYEGHAILRDPTGEFACFPRGTNITLSDRSLKPVESLTVKDELLVYSPHSGCFSKAPVVRIIHAEAHECYVLNGDLAVTPSHLVFSDGRFIAVREVRVGSGLLTDAGETQTLESLVLRRELGEVFNVEAAEGQAFFAGRLLVASFSSKIPAFAQQQNEEEIVEIDEQGNVVRSRTPGCRRPRATARENTLKLAPPAAPEPDRWLIHSEGVAHGGC